MIKLAISPVSRAFDCVRIDLVESMKPPKNSFPYVLSVLSFIAIGLTSYNQ